MRKDIWVAVAIAVLIVLLAGSLMYTFVFNVPKSQYDSLENSYSDLQNSYTTLQGEKDDFEAQLEAIEAKYPLRNFTSKGELEDWIDSHSYPTTLGDDDEFDNALQVQIDAMNEGYLAGIQMDWYSDLGSYWIGNSAMAGNVFYHFRVGDDALYAQPFP